MNTEIIKYEEADWLENINFDELEKLAAIGYSIEKLAKYFLIPEQQFIYEFLKVESKLKYHYDRGILYYSGKEGMVMLDESLKNNTTQGQRLDKLRKIQRFEELKQDIIYGTEDKV